MDFPLFPQMGLDRNPLLSFLAGGVVVVVVVLALLTNLG
jgi:hypothetical protein